MSLPRLAIIAMLSEYHFSDTSLTLEQDPTLGHGGTIWDAGLSLSGFLARQAAVFSPATTALELGSGTGLCGLIMQKAADCEVCLTDLPELLPLLQRNADRNQCRKAVVKELRWESRTSLGQFDVILGSDLAYIRDLHQPLIDTIVANSKSTTVVFLSFELRKETDSLLISDLQARGWSANAISPALLNPAFDSRDLLVYAFRR